MAPPGRHRGSRLIAWGGRDEGSSRLNTGGVYDPAADRWTAIATDDAPSTRAFHTVVSTGSRMIVWGGERRSYPLNCWGVYQPPQR